jgi:hypothetical protein
MFHTDNVIRAYDVESLDHGTQQSEFVIQLTALVMFFQREEAKLVEGTVVLS